MVGVQIAWEYPLKGKDEETKNNGINRENLIY
jgi:hypothetical protein